MAKYKSGKSQPQTAALPGGSCAAEPLNDRFASTAHDAPSQSPELDAAEDREGQADRCQGNQSLKAGMGLTPFVDGGNAVGFAGLMKRLMP